MFDFDKVIVLKQYVLKNVTSFLFINNSIIYVQTNYENYREKYKFQ